MNSALDRRQTGVGPGRAAEAAAETRPRPRLDLRVALLADWDGAVRISRGVEHYARALFRDQEVVDAIAMTCSELLENAVKYGLEAPHEGAARVQLRVYADATSMSIAVANACVSRDEACRALEEVIDLIAEAVDLEALYQQRMLDVFTGATRSGGLGLVRIAYEGRCRLECRVTREGTVEVRAHRTAPRPTQQLAEAGEVEVLA